MKSRMMGERSMMRARFHVTNIRASFRATLPAAAVCPPDADGMAIGTLTPVFVAGAVTVWLGNGSIFFAPTSNVYCGIAVKT